MQRRDSQPSASKHSAPKAPGLSLARAAAGRCCSVTCAGPGSSLSVARAGAEKRSSSQPPRHTANNTHTSKRILVCSPPPRSFATIHRVSAADTPHAAPLQPHSFADRGLAIGDCAAQTRPAKLDRAHSLGPMWPTCRHRVDCAWESVLFRPAHAPHCTQSHAREVEVTTSTEEASSAKDREVGEEASRQGNEGAGARV